MIADDALAPLIADYVSRQRWFAGTGAHDVAIRAREVVRDGEPGLVWTLADVDGATYQVVVGFRPVDHLPDFLQGKERVTLGVVDGELFYDALIDPGLAIEVLNVVAPDEQVEVARPLVVEQSNSSVIYDERLILKLFRRIHPEPNPDVEVNRVLHEHGFPHVVPQVAELRRDGLDLAVVREFLKGASDAWQIAHTSLRDLLASRLPPEECGGDFAPEAVQLGVLTAELHLALAEVYGVDKPETDDWVQMFLTQLDRVGGDFDREAVRAAFARVRVVSDPGRAIRVHGDLHLGQVLHADAGWFVLDFEGEPNRPVSERTRLTSPLKDVAGMLRSFHYAAATGLIERGGDIDGELAALADAWEERASEAYQMGYLRTSGIDELLPADEGDRSAILAAFELDKAVYEVGYELDHRPDWVGIPLSAIERTLSP